MDRLRAWARRLKADVLALWIAAGDLRTPIGAKLVAALVAAYALSPIDLVPDFIPVLGLLDDLLLIPAGIWLAVRLIPAPLRAQFRAEAARWSERPRSRRGAALVLLVWVTTLVALAVWLKG